MYNITLIIHNAHNYEKKRVILRFLLNVYKMIFSNDITIVL